MAFLFTRNHCNYFPLRLESFEISLFFANHYVTIKEQELLQVLTKLYRAHLGKIYHLLQHKTIFCLLCCMVHCNKWASNCKYLLINRTLAKTVKTFNYKEHLYEQATVATGDAMRFITTHVCHSKLTVSSSVTL